MFGHPRYVIKGGEIVIEEGDIRATPEGREFMVKPSYDPGTEEFLQPLFEDCYTHVVRELSGRDGTDRAPRHPRLHRTPNDHADTETTTDGDAGGGSDFARSCLRTCRTIRSAPASSITANASCRLDDFFEVDGERSDDD